MALARETMKTKVFHLLKHYHVNSNSLVLEVSVAMATGLLVFFVELLEFREDRNPWESVEAKLNAIR